jgi:hypothetical protein
MTTAQLSILDPQRREVPTIRTVITSADASEVLTMPLRPHPEADPAKLTWLDSGSDSRYRTFACALSKTSVNHALADVTFLGVIAENKLIKSRDKARHECSSLFMDPN